MLFNLLAPLAEKFEPFNLFRYITFRTGGAIATALLISFVLGPHLIGWLRSKQGAGQPIRDDGPESHLISKKGTPTMGGVLILAALILSTLLWADVTNGYVWLVVFVTAGFGAIGAADDYLKLSRRSSKGLPGRMKLLSEVAIALLAAIWVLHHAPSPLNTSFAVPFF